MTRPAPEEAAAIAAALAIVAERERKAQKSVREPGASRWRDAGRTYAAFDERRP